MQNDSYVAEFHSNKPMTFIKSFFCEIFPSQFCCFNLSPEISFYQLFIFFSVDWRADVYAVVHISQLQLQRVFSQEKANKHKKSMPQIKFYYQVYFYNIWHIRTRCIIRNWALKRWHYFLPVKISQRAHLSVRKAKEKTESLYLLRHYRKEKRCHRWALILALPRL